MVGIDYRAIFESVDDALLVVDADTEEILDGNQQCCALLDTDTSSLEGRGLSTLLVEAETGLPAFDAVTHRESDADPAISKGTLAIDDSEPVPVELRFSPLSADTVLVTVRRRLGSDGTTQPQRGDQVMTQLFEHTPDVMWMFSADWDEYVFVNDAYEDVFGLSLRELQEDPTQFLQGIHPEDRDRVQTAMQGLSEGHRIDMEYRVDPSSDFGRHVWVQGTPIRDRSGEVYRVAGFVREITERRERELELLRQQKLVGNIPIGVFRVSFGDEQRLTQVNPALVSMLEAGDETDLLGRTVASFFVDDDAGTTLLEDLRQQQTVTFETRFQTLEGTVFWGRLTAVLQTGDQGQLVVDGVVEDITARKHRQRQLRVVDRILRHNMRNDISVISGYATYLAENPDQPDDAIDSILTRSRELLRTAEKGHVVVDALSEGVETTAFDIVPDLSRTIEGLRDLFPQATIDAEVPDEVVVDALRDVDLAIHELIENSIVHHDDSPAIDLGVETTDDTVTVRVSDDGPGIPRREYEILSGTEDVDPLSHGSGMGLWLVHWVVRLSGGDIDFESDDCGSTVTITLPAGTDQSATPVTDHPPSGNQ